MQGIISAVKPLFFLLKLTKTFLQQNVPKYIIFSASLHKHLANETEQLLCVLSTDQPADLFYRIQWKVNLKRFQMAELLIRFPLFLFPLCQFWKEEYQFLQQYTLLN